MDPCGAFVDLIRRPYTTKCRFFRDNPIEIDISWYPCKPDAPALDTPSVISSLDWWVQERELGVYSGYSVGEVPDRPRKWNGLKRKPNADGLHRCGTEDEWANGAVFDPSLARVRRADGLPTCCGGVPPGVVIGGRAGMLPLQPGVVVGGRANPLAPGPTARGGVVVGGTAGAGACCFDGSTGHPDLSVTIPDGPRSSGSPFRAVWSVTDFRWEYVDGSAEECHIFCMSGHWFIVGVDTGFLGDSRTFTCDPLAVLMSDGFGSSVSVTITLAP